MEQNAYFYTSPLPNYLHSLVIIMVQPWFRVCICCESVDQMIPVEARLSYISIS